MNILKVPNPFNAPVYHEGTVKSTMDVSKTLACGGAAAGTVICADFQEEGRGRGLERKWEMERGENLSFTVLLVFPRMEDIAPALTLRTGLAVSLAVEETSPSLKNRVKVKWPNDIMIDDKKICGILCEADVAGGCNVHVGIGVNVMQKEFPPHLRHNATSIFLETQEADSGKMIVNGFYLLEKILARLYDELRCADGDWKDRLERRLYKKGEDVTFIDGTVDSGKEIKGCLAGINENGGLLIVPGGKTEPTVFIAGELKIY